MITLEEKIQQRKQSPGISLMTHVVVGYPTLSETERIIETMAGNGADFIELQIPFSDPLADGPTIMRSCEKSLENGTRVKDAFMIMKKLSSKVTVPLVFMAYYNTVFVYGTENFIKDAKAAGCAGLIVPDMALDEEDQEHFYKLCRKNDMPTIQVISPASTMERLKKNAEVANGFIYCTARQGTTGAKDQMDRDLESYLKKIRQYFPLPIAVGFGISKRSHVKLLEPLCDIAVVGSALIDVINRSNTANLTQNIIDFLHMLRED